MRRFKKIMNYQKLQWVQLKITKYNECHKDNVIHIGVSCESSSLGENVIWFTNLYTFLSTKQITEDEIGDTSRGKRFFICVPRNKKNQSSYFPYKIILLHVSSLNRSILTPLSINLGIYCSFSELCVLRHNIVH